MVNYLVFALLGIPLVGAILMLFFKDGAARKFLTYIFAGLTAICSIALCVIGFNQGYVQVEIPGGANTVQILSYISMAISITVGLVGLYWTIRYKKPLAIVLAAVSLAGAIYCEFFVFEELDVDVVFYIDQLTLIMTFIIGVIGSGICVYALGYMTDFNKHQDPGKRDRSNEFFSLMFLFLSAMFLIVFSNDLTFLFCGWEVTTLCSFLLIGYTRTEEAINNSIRQIVMNLLGGIAFLLAMYISATQMETLSLSEFIETGLSSVSAASLPACLFAFAAITKAAQMPFHTWLLGAMVAPTPTSALLHSSTMVKAGVFLLVKLAPLFSVCIYPHIMVMLAGGVTFLLCSCMAISQTNAKRVLAYSTIANLGLITACAGVGSPEAIWAAIFLIIFHAAAKSLMFLCVGTADHHINSLDIEDMDGLFVKMPRLARFMMVGIMAMFVAPFGMLISKWAALVSFVDSSQIVLILILAFGSAVTFVFWAKWLGKLAGVVANEKNIEKTVHKSEWIAQTTMLVLVILFVIAMPWLSDNMVTTYLAQCFASFGQYGLYAVYYSQYVTADNLYMCIIFLVVIAIVLFAGIGRKGKYNKQKVYLAGAGIDHDERTYLGSMGVKMKATAKNMYLNTWFGEKRLSPIGSILNTVIFILAAVVATLSMMGII